MNARKFVLIYFKTVKATQSTQGQKKKNSAKKSQHAAKENEFTPQQRKTRPQNKPGKLIGSRLMQVILKHAAFCERFV